MSSSSGSQLNKSRRVGIALMGTGRMGYIHLQNILKEVQIKLLYAFDADTERLEQVSKDLFFDDFGIKALPSSQYDVALQDPAVEGVVIATPTFTHQDYTQRALAAGKNVMCEKPLCPGTNDILPLYDLAKEKKVFLLCAFNRRYDPDYRHLHKKIQKEKSLGPIQSIKITSRDSPRPELNYLRTSGDLFHDSGVHDINMCCWLAAQLPDTVQVTVKTWKEYFNHELEFDPFALTEAEQKLSKEIDDAFLAVITLKFPDGTLGIIDNSRETHYGYDQRAEVYGTKGMLRCQGKYERNTTEAGETGIAHPPFHWGIANRFKAAYKTELRDFITMVQLAKSGLFENDRIVRENLLEPPRSLLVVATHKIADACVEAWKSNQTVHLTWPEEFKKQFMYDITN